MDSPTDNLVKLRGLPWATTAKEVLEFLKDCNIKGEEYGIHMITSEDGRPSGQCFVELWSEHDVEMAKGHNNEELGSRYIEIFDGKRSEMDWILNRMPGASRTGGDEDSVFIKLRGLPFESSNKDIADFFSGIEIAPYGITITMDRNGRPSGEAYLELASVGEVEKALLKNKEKMGRRYIEIFKCSKHDIKHISTQSNNLNGGVSNFQMMGGRPGPYDRPGFGGGRDPGGGVPGPIGRGRLPPLVGPGARTGAAAKVAKVLQMAVGAGTPDKDSKTGHQIYMRGLPFEATQGDVYRFLAPIIPTEVRMLTKEDGKPKGECHVDFDTHSDCVEAMSKNKHIMGHRYVDMFLRSQPTFSESEPIVLVNFNK